MGFGVCVCVGGGGGWVSKKYGLKEGTCENMGG